MRSVPRRAIHAVQFPISFRVILDHLLPFSASLERRPITLATSFTLPLGVAQVLYAERAPHSPRRCAVPARRSSRRRSALCRLDEFVCTFHDRRQIPSATAFMFF